MVRGEWLACAFRRFASLICCWGRIFFFRVVVATARTRRRRENGMVCVIVASVSEAMQLACAGSWIASSRSLLAMTRSGVRR